MLALVAIGTTSDAVQKRQGLWKYLLPQLLLVASALAMGLCAAQLPPVALLLGLFSFCAGQVILAQLEMFVPRRFSNKARQLLVRWI